MLSDVGQSMIPLRRQVLTCPSTLTQTVRYDCDSSCSLSSSPLMNAFRRLPRLSFTNTTLLVELPWRQSPSRHQRLSSIRPSSHRPLSNEPNQRLRKPRRINCPHLRSRQLLHAHQARQAHQAQASPNNPRAAMVRTRAAAGSRMFVSIGLTLCSGCVTCKAKRLKCDETKPKCQQCHKRQVECGGYKKDFKWRAFEEATFITKLASPTLGKGIQKFSVGKEDS